MKQSVVILSKDRLFAEMLALEISMLRLHATVAEDAKQAFAAEIVIWDLDSTDPPHRSSYRRLIGFTKQSTLSNRHAGRECSLILRRPFELLLLRQEVLNLLHDLDDPSIQNGFSGERMPMDRQMHIDLERAVLLYGEDVIPLSPTEAQILDCLVENRGRVVSRKTLSDRIGDSCTNKVDVYVCYLRRKMKTVAEKDRIVTVRNQGYTIL